MLLGAGMYAAVILVSPFAFGEWTLTEYQPLVLPVAGGWNLLLLVVTVIVIVDSVRKIRAKKTKQLVTDAFVVKLVAIPFFALNYVVLAFLFIGGAVFIIFGGLVLWVVVAIGSGLTYLAMLSTSVYAWAAIAQLRRERIIGTGLAVLYTLLSLVFVTDIATGILLLGHYRRRPILALVIVLLSFGLILGGIGLWIGLETGFSFDTSQGHYGGISGVVGGAALLVSIAVSVVLMPALRREARRPALADAASSAA